MDSSMGSGLISQLGVCGLKTHKHGLSICIGTWKDIEDEVAALQQAQKNAEEIERSLESYSRERYHHT